MSKKKVGRPGPNSFKLPRHIKTDHDAEYFNAKYKVGHKFVHKLTGEELEVLSFELTGDYEKCLYLCSNGISYSEFEIGYHNYCHSRKCHSRK